MRKWFYSLRWAVCAVLLWAMGDLTVFAGENSVVFKHHFLTKSSMPFPEAPQLDKAVADRDGKRLMEQILGIQGGNPAGPSNYDADIPDWVVGVDLKSQKSFSRLLIGKYEYPKAGEKSSEEVWAPELKDHIYMYAVVLIRMPSSAVSQKPATIFDIQQTSSNKYVSASQGIWNTLAGDLWSGNGFFKNSAAASAPATDIYSPAPVTLYPLAVDNATDSAYYLGMTRLKLNPNSSNRLTLHFSNVAVDGKGKPTGYPNMLTTNFIARDTNKLGLSIALGVDATPDILNPDGLSRFNSGGAALLAHFYPLDPSPFSDDRFSSLNLFCGVPLAGLPQSSSLNLIYVGAGFGNLWGRDTGIAIGYGWDFSQNRAPHLLLGLLDCKL